VSIADVDVLGVEAWIAAMGRKGGGATTVLRAYGVQSGILASAVKGKRLAANPAMGVENLPRKTGKRRVYLSADDLRRVADEFGHTAEVVDGVVSGRGPKGQGAEDHSARSPPHLRIARSVCWGQCLGAATDARAHVSKDDAGHLRGPVR
jgi:hypothetical protein